jgi:hypothetical protein
MIRSHSFRCRLGNSQRPITHISASWDYRSGIGPAAMRTLVPAKLMGPPSRGALRTLLRSLSVVARGSNEKENQKASACRRQEQPCALLACRAYGAMLAKHVGTELAPARSPRTKASR